MKGTENLKRVAAKLRDALNLGGHLIMANANQTIDDPKAPGFDWGLEFGAKTIGELFAKTPGLYLVKEIRTPLYRIQLFQRKKRWSWPVKTQLKSMPQPTSLPPQVEDTVRWNGGTPSTPIYHETVSTDNLPILMYHRVAPDGAANMRRYRVTPERFEQQLCFLKESGYYTPDPDQWLTAIINRKSLPGRAILLSFDDGYSDFYDHAAPLLIKYGFSAIVFIVTGHVGETNRWDRAYGEELPLMNWKQIRELRAAGLHFGSHTVHHFPITGLSNEKIIEEAALSRASLQRQLEMPIHTIAFPYGDVDEAALQLLGACGYTMGFSCNEAFSHYDDNPLSLPRIEITCDDTLQDFIRKITL